MITQIGIIAGEIWRYLDDNEEIILSEICGILDHPKDLILMSVGWLAREGHVILKKDDGDFRVSLRYGKKQ